MSNAADQDYTTTDTCDGCGEHARGTMFHAAGATGRVCPVLFLCFACSGHEDPEAAPEPSTPDPEPVGEPYEPSTPDPEDGDEEYDEEPWDGFNTDAEADADVLASAGWGCDEDYGCFGGDEW